jgi:hypothetical protein
MDNDRNKLLIYALIIGLCVFLGIICGIWLTDSHSVNVFFPPLFIAGLLGMLISLYHILIQSIILIKKRTTCTGFLLSASLVHQYFS